MANDIPGGGQRLLDYIVSLPVYNGGNIGAGIPGESYSVGDMIRIGTQVYMCTADTDVSPEILGSPWQLTNPEQFQYDIEEGSVIGFPLGLETRTELTGVVRTSGINISVDADNIVTATFQTDTALAVNAAEIATLLGVDAAEIVGTNLVFRFGPQTGVSEYFRAIFQVTGVDNTSGTAIVSMTQLDDQPINDMVGDSTTVQKWAVLQDITQTFTQLSRTALVGFPPTSGIPAGSIVRFLLDDLDNFYLTSNELNSDADLIGLLLSFGSETEQYTIISSFRSITTLIVFLRAGGTARNTVNTPNLTGVTVIQTSDPIDFRTLVAGAGVAFVSDPVTDELVISATAAGGGALTTDGVGGVFVAAGTVPTDFRRVLATGTNSDGLDSLRNFSNASDTGVNNPDLFSFLQLSSPGTIDPTEDPVTGRFTFNVSLLNTVNPTLIALIEDVLTPGSSFLLDFTGSTATISYKIVSAYSRVDPANPAGRDLYLSFHFLSSSIATTETSNFNAASTNSATLFNIDTASLGLVSKAADNRYGVNSYADVAASIQPHLVISAVDVDADRVFDFVGLTRVDAIGSSTGTMLRLTLSGTEDVNTLMPATGDYIIDLVGTAQFTVTAVYRISDDAHAGRIVDGRTISYPVDTTLVRLSGGTIIPGIIAGQSGQFASQSLYATQTLKTQGIAYADEVLSLSNITVTTDDPTDLTRVQVHSVFAADARNDQRILKSNIDHLALGETDDNSRVYSTGRVDELITASGLTSLNDVPGLTAALGFKVDEDKIVIELDTNTLETTANADLYSVGRADELLLDKLDVTDAHGSGRESLINLTDVATPVVYETGENIFLSAAFDRINAENSYFTVPQTGRWPMVALSDDEVAAVDAVVPGHIQVDFGTGPITFFIESEDLFNGNERSVAFKILTGADLYAALPTGYTQGSFHRIALPTLANAVAVADMSNTLEDGQVVTWNQANSLFEFTTPLTIADVQADNDSRYLRKDINTTTPGELVLSLRAGLTGIEGDDFFYTLENVLETADAEMYTARAEVLPALDPLIPTDLVNHNADTEVTRFTYRTGNVANTGVIVAIRYLFTTTTGGSGFNTRSS